MTMAMPSRAPLLRETTRTTTPTKAQTLLRRPIDDKVITTTSSSSSSSWASLDKLVTLDRGYPLERSHVQFPKSHLGTAWLARLTTALYHLNCAVHYDTSHVAATCRAMSDSVVFHIHVFAAGSDTAIVEVQRLAGDSWAFSKHYAQPLLRMVKQQPERPCRSTSTSTTMPRTTSSSLSSSCPVSEDDIQDALQLASHMITEDRLLDQVHLGLESLVSLTNPSSVGETTAACAVTILLRKQQYQPLLDTLQRLLLEESNYPALLIWVHIWQVTAVAPRSNETILPCTAVMEHLLRLVAQDEPHAATLAWRGLTALGQLHPSLVTAHISPTMVPAVPQHAALAHASRQWLLSVQA